MPLCDRSPFEDAKNYVFVGEAGCGKSELAVNLAYTLRNQQQDVHFFDLDQTKPLFRSRDLKEQMEADGIFFHYENQFYDAPTIVGGIALNLAAEFGRCVLDIGGNDTGSRVIGGFASLINRENTTVYFVINPYRPWSKDTEAIIETLQSIMTASRLQSVRVICNPTLGASTSEEEVLEGIRRTEEMLAGVLAIDFVSVQKTLADKITGRIPYGVYPMDLYLQYPWNVDQ